MVSVEIAVTVLDAVEPIDMVCRGELLLDSVETYDIVLDTDGDDE